MAHDYLLKEYDLCFEQLRFYDSRQESLLKYLCSLTSAVVTAEFAVYGMLHGATSGFYRFEGFLSGLVFVATVLLFLAMLQNRLYFVIVARQLNAIRGYLMEVAAEGFTKNQMYTTTSFPALKPFSLHTVQIVGVTCLSALFAGASTYGSLTSLAWPHPAADAAIVTAFILVVQTGAGVAYLLWRGQKSANLAIHHKAQD